jgi:hypothetical protein
MVVTAERSSPTKAAEQGLRVVSEDTTAGATEDAESPAKIDNGGQQVDGGAYDGIR